MLKLKLTDPKVAKAMKGDEELHDLVKQTEDLLDEMINMSDVYINNISDNDMKFINDLFKISKSSLIMAANERRAIHTILENQETIMDKIKDIDRKIDNIGNFELV